MKMWCAFTVRYYSTVKKQEIIKSQVNDGPRKDHLHEVIRTDKRYVLSRQRLLAPVFRWNTCPEIATESRALKRDHWWGAWIGSNREGEHSWLMESLGPFSIACMADSTFQNSGEHAP